MTEAEAREIAREIVQRAADGGWTDGGDVLLIHPDELEELAAKVIVEWLGDSGRTESEGG